MLFRSMSAGIQCRLYKNNLKVLQRVGKQMKEKVAVVIPYYHSQLSEQEEISFRQCLKVLCAYPIILVVPEFMNEEEYPVKCGVKFEKVPFEWMRSVSTYNRMMLDEMFYIRFMEYEYILIYQLDAFVFYDALNEFCDLGYDYIGAPWPMGVRYVKNVKECMWYVGNGGFSLRNVAASISMIRTNTAKEWRGPEDVYWATCNSMEFRVAPLEIARLFSIEEQVRKMISLNENKVPFGCHAWAKMDFMFWKPLIEAEGYVFAEKITGDLDKNMDKEMDMLAIPKGIAERCVRGFSKGQKTQIYIWGTGEVGMETGLFLRYFDFPIRYVDSNKKRQGKYLWGILIEDPDVLGKNTGDKTVFIAARNRRDEVKNQLLKMGFHYHQNFFFYEEIQTKVEEICISYDNLLNMWMNIFRNRKFG